MRLMGPKMLCNACGVQYKSSQLVSESCSAASPTFVFSQHSNSHCKAMKLHHQKELLLFRHDGNPSTSVAAYVTSQWVCSLFMVGWGM